MKRTHKKRPPSPAARQTWEPFVRLPVFWEEIKQRIIFNTESTQEGLKSVLLKTNDI